MSRDVRRSHPSMPRPGAAAVPDASGDLAERALLPFVLLTFGITWGILGFHVVAPEAAERILGVMSATHPLFIVAVWAPALAALLLVARRTGREGVVRYLGRLRLWRAPAGWWAFLLLGLPGVFVAGAVLKGTPVGGLLPEAAPGELAAAMAFMAILGPVEELGWRGLALPILQRRRSPFTASVLLGVVWGVWHLPAFLLSGTPQSGWGFTPFLVGSVAISVVLTPFFNAARGSLLVAVLFHYQLINPLWPDAQPWDSWILVGVAAGAVSLHRDTMLRPGSGATEVVPSEPRPPASSPLPMADAARREAPSGPGPA